MILLSFNGSLLVMAPPAGFATKPIVVTTESPIAAACSVKPHPPVSTDVCRNVGR